jgi:hypothetical protein
MLTKNYVKPACRQTDFTKIALKGNLLVKFDKICQHIDWLN